MQASIIVCTYNRADSLKKTLDALAGLEVPAQFSWEIVVVDNNSSDSTRAVIESYMLKMDNLRYVFQKEQGLSHARNKGIEQSSGDIVLFTDDDVCPESNWLHQSVLNMEEHHCDACGGYIAPAWEQPPPSWLTERFYGFLAIKTDAGPCQVELGGSLPFGANMVFRREVFEKAGLFDTSRGRKGAVLASGEDGEMFERILAAGRKVVYFDNARVHHHIEVFRTRKQYFRRWRYQTSLNLAQSRGLKGERRILGIPLYLFPQLVRAVGRWVMAKLAKPADEAFNREIIIFHFLGTIRGLYLSRDVGEGCSL